MRFIPIVVSCLLVPGASAAAQNLEIRDAKVYVSPNAPPLTYATVVIAAGKIAEVGSNVRAPAGTMSLPCDGCVIFAGFWNAHVHFTGSQWDGAASRPAGELTRSMQTMLTHSGFTTVVDVASDPVNTVALRRRVESGEVAGPKIYTSGFGLYPPHGIPFYLDELPEVTRAKLPQPESVAAAMQAVRANQAQGSDVAKLFTGAYLSPDKIIHMPLDIATAAARSAHEKEQLVFAHPSDLEGARIAIESGVDVLAHAPDTVAGVDALFIRKMVDRHVAMTPTLKLFAGSGHIKEIRAVVTEFYRDGGRLLFGTDTGFLTDWDVSEEYRQLQLAGLTFREVLSMLTVNPVEEFHLSAHAGQVRVGYAGDLTVLAGDPSSGGFREFAHVVYAIRGGRVIFSADAR